LLTFHVSSASFANPVSLASAMAKVTVSPCLKIASAWSNVTVMGGDFLGGAAEVAAPSAMKKRTVSACCMYRDIGGLFQALYVQNDGIHLGVCQDT